MTNIQIENFWKKVNVKENEECWEWNASFRKNGYGAFKTKTKTHGAHRLSYELTNGFIIDSSLKVCHTCDNRKCVNPNHLFLGTQKENMQDCKNKGRLVVPEGIKFKTSRKSDNALITNDKALEIFNIIKFRRIHKEPLNLRSLSLQYNIPYNSIRDISCGRTYINK